MFLAIINDTYAEVKEDVTNKPAEFSMGDFFSTGVNNVKGSMGIVDRYQSWIRIFHTPRILYYFYIWNKYKILQINNQLSSLYRGVDVENAIKLAAADDGFVTYDEIRENLRK